MAIDIYKRYTNPVSGEAIKCISVSPDSYTLQWNLNAHGYVPFEHIHCCQEEIFYVQKGELKIIIDGVEHIAMAGDAILVPEGVRHTACNNQPVPLEAIVTYAPTLDQVLVMQCICGLMQDGYVNRKGRISPMRMGYCLRRMKCKAVVRPPGFPTPVFNIVLQLCYVVGTLRGWGRLYEKYTV